MRKCDSCGKLYHESRDVFCPHCGAVAQKQCTHSSSFDSGRYDRGEIYKGSSSDYKSTAYRPDSEPHAQRQQTAYSPKQTTFGNKDDYGNKTPEINLPDFKKVLSKVNTQNGKLIGIIIIVCVIAFNFLLGIIGTNEVIDDTGLWEEASEAYVEEDISDIYTIVDSAKIEMVGEDGKFKAFTLEISGMGFDDELPENLQSDIASGTMAKDMLSHSTFVDMLICDFPKEIVAEDVYNNVLNDCYYTTGAQLDNKCKYKFSYSFAYDEIVHIAGGINFYLDNGLYINAELPFSAFSVSEDGEITYYTSYADEQTAWNTVFSECSNEQEIGLDLNIDFGAVVTVEGE